MELDDELAAAARRGVRWGVEVRDLASGAVRLSHQPHRLLRTASVAKVFLLVEVARRLHDGTLRSDQPLRRDRVPPVADSGLWQHLVTEELPLVDVARLVGSVSDNWATNVLLDLVGLPAVQQVARALAPGGSMLHDAVRDRRTAAHPASLSEGCAHDWTRVFAGLAAGTVVGPGASRTVLGWLATGHDLSMVASALGLDPLAHAEPDRGVSLWSKTGTDSTGRSDVGLVRGPAGSITYAALCTWDAATPDPRDGVLATMRRIGTRVAGLVGAG